MDSNNFVLRRIGVSEPRYIPLSRTEMVAIGRREGCVFIPSVCVSRDHLKIWYDSGYYLIKDYKSLNGTFVLQNNVLTKLEPYFSFALLPGAIIGIGADPIAWRAEEDWAENPNFAIYEFVPVSDHDPGLADLCNAFSCQVNV